MPSKVFRFAAKNVLTIAAFAIGASAQATHTVMVGNRGSFYDPPTLSTLDGDTVTFVFVAGLHGVTQSTFDAPCLQLAGGFNSGLLTGPGVNATVPYATWDLKIQNASQPIFYFCQATVPVSHCANGMVGAINAPADQYESFTSAAKTVSGTPAPQTSAVLTGVGAFATATPSAPPAPPSSSTTAPSSSGTPTQTSAPPPAHKSSNIGAIVGGAVGGVAIVIIGVLLFLLWRSKQKHAKALNGNASKVGFNNTGMSDEGKFVAPQGTGGSSGPFPPPQGLYGNPAPYQQSGPAFDSNGGLAPPIAAPVPVSFTREFGFSSGEANPNTGSTGATYATAASYGAQRNDTSEALNSPPLTGGFSGASDGGYNRTSQYTDVASSHNVPLQAPPSPAANANANVNYHELAKEVAAILGPHVRPDARTMSPPPPPGAGAGLLQQPYPQPSPLAQQIAAQMGAGNQSQVTYNPNLAARLPYDLPSSPVGSSRSPGPPQYERFAQ